jgi:tetratricopeptide (TPR) repeat protein
MPPPDADRVSNVDTRPMRDPSQLRMAPRTGNHDVEIIWVRLRGLPGGVLVPAQDEGDDGGLQMAEGLTGDIELLLGQAKPQDALALLQGPHSLPRAELETLRARAFLMDGRVDEARDALGDRDRPEVALGDAALALAEGDLERAERRIVEAISAAPRAVGPVYLHSLVRVSRGDMQQGAELLSAVARAVPSHAVARFQLGQILFAQGDPARAGTLYEMAWDLEPTFVSPPLALCEMLVESRQYSEALGILERACAASPTSLPPRQLQLRILVELGERDAALDLGRRLHEQVPYDHDTTLLFAETLIDAGRSDEAATVLAEIITLPGVDAGQAVRAQRLQSRIALGQKRIDEALELLRDAARSAPPALVGEVALELVHVGIAQERMADADLGLSLLTRSSDVSSLVSGALLARQHQLSSRARALAQRAKELVPGTPAAAQLESFMAALP